MQFVGALFIIGLNIVMTSIIFVFIEHGLRVKLRLPIDKLIKGDDAVHGEFTYASNQSRRTPRQADAENNIPEENQQANEV